VSLRPDEVGWVPQHPALYSKLSAAENLKLFARLERAKRGHRRHGRRPWRSGGRPDAGPGKTFDVKGAVERMLAQTQLADRARDEVSQLSGGNRQRLNIAIGLLGDPTVLLLDEPSSSLDPRQRERLWSFIGGLAAGGTTVVYSTHNVGEAERYADRVLVLADGELLFTGTPAELERTVGGQAAAPDFEAAFVRFLHDRGH
jgi:ABC-2 type transport system ATP-binding protein